MKKIILIIIPVVLLFSCSENKQQSDLNQNSAYFGKDTTPKTKELPTLNKKIGNKIPGIKPCDVYLNMEQRGFDINKIFNAEYGNSWICNKYDNADETNYEVSIFSMGSDDVETIRATATCDGNNIKITKPFFKFIASIPFDRNNQGNNQIKIFNWIGNNFNKNKSSVTISNVKFTIFAPSKYVRMMDIEKVINN